VEVVGRGLDPDENDLLAAIDPGDRVIGREDGSTNRRSRRRIETVRDPRGCLDRGRIVLIAQELVDMGRLDPGERLLLGDHALGDHVRGDLDGRCGGPLG
jgi:hypothetical protein